MPGNDFNPCRVTTMFILFFSCFILQAVTVKGFRFLSIPHNDFYSDIESPLITDEYTLVSPGSVYGLCNGNPHNKAEDYCIFYMETSSNVNSSEHLRKCKFTFNNCNQPKCFLLSLIRDIVAIDKDKAVLITHRLLSNDGIIDILDFSGCNVTPVPIRRDLIRGDLDVKASIVGAPTYDTFDVYLKIEDRQSTNGRYQGIFDFNGNTITMKDVMNIGHNIEDSNLIMHSPLKGRFIVRTGSQGKSILIYRDDDDGSSEFIESYRLRGDIGDNVDEHYAASITNQLLTACGRYYENITCGQFDDNGNIKFETRVRVPESLEIDTLKAFNLPGGGFLLLIVRCTDNPKESYYCGNPGQDVTVTKIDATGVVRGSLTIDQFPIKAHSAIRNPQFHFFENKENKEMCLSLLDWKPDTYEDKVTLNIACFKDQDFHP